MHRHLSLAVLMAFVVVSPLWAQEKAAPSASDLAAKGVQFLRGSQADDGSFSKEAGPGVTALVATALLRSGHTTNDPAVAKAVEYVLKHRQDDGGIYGEGSRYKNYETSLAVMCLSEANADGRFKDTIASAEKYLKKLQWDDEEGHGIDSPSYGGGGYGSHSRPDLSNTSFLIDALKAAGAKEDDPALQKALLFVSRSQNLETEHNATEFAGKVNDGGFYYTPAAGGSSQAGTTANGGLRSYGSMTYAGLKSMIYAGVDADDPRVAAAYKWIQQHFTLAENPGMGQQGLFYYFHTFAKALDAIGEDEIVDSDGTRHRWRDELTARLAELQQDNGSWLNENDRWMEADPNLVTGYALLALSYCHE
jgi:squalene-hopene/tetraprenyl-beta-curcumene cyclase